MAERVAEAVSTCLTGARPTLRRRSTGLETLGEVGRDGGPISSDTERAIARSSGTSLEAPVRRQFENSFGTDLSGVRVHRGNEVDQLNERLNSLAFTTGSDVFLSRQVADVNSREGQHTLAHELTHVVQNAGGSGPAPVRRLQATADFKTATPGKFRFRSGVSGIDKGLESYDKIKGGFADIGARKTSLDNLKQLCTAYGGSRTTGVTALSTAIDTEKGYIDLLFTAAGLEASDPKGLFTTTLEARERFLEAERGGHTIGFAPAFDQWISKSLQELAKRKTRAQAMQEIIHEDVAKLESMAADGLVDNTVRNILNEILANKDDIHFQETGGVASGAVLAGEKDQAKGITEKYRLDMQMDQKQGEPERLSSLVHEMTHIATQEKFDNTPIHLAMAKVDLNDPAARAQGIIAGVTLSRHRTGEINALKGLVAGLQPPLSPDQIKVIQEKVTYPIEGKNTLKSYANAFKTKGMTPEEFAFVNDLEDAGANNTLTEYDTVVNQMMFLVASWKVPPNNPFYVKVKQMADDALAHRA